MRGDQFERIEPQPAMSEEQKLKLCQGCENDFYNDKNPLGVKRCWSLEGAVLVHKRFVHVDQVPPWNQAPEATLDCHRRKRYISVHPRVTK